MRSPPDVSTPPPRRPAPARIALDTALAFGLTAAFLDGAVDLAVRAPGSPSPLRTLPVLGTTALLGALAFGVVWLLTWPGRAARPPRARDLSAWAFGLGSALLVVTLALLVTCFRGEQPVPATVLMPLPGALVIGGGLYLLVRKVSQLGGFAPVARVALCLVPLASGLVCLFLFARREWLDGSMVQQLGGLAFTTLAGVGLAWVLWSVRARLHSTGLLALGLVAIVSLGAVRVVPSSGIPVGAGASGAIRTPRHVVLIVVDTLRADHLSCYSDSAPDTPTLDAFARESLQFTQTRSSAPFTFPSMCSILTGLAPTVHLGLHPSTALPAAVPTLAERLSNAGYLTGAIVRNPSLRPTCKINQGFDEYLFQREPEPPTAIGELALRWILPEQYRPQVGAKVQTRRASEWIERNQEKDFFLWVQYFDPHMAYGPPSAYLPPGASPPARVGRRFEDAANVRGGFFVPDHPEREWIRELYAGEVRYLDAEIAGLFETMRRLDLYDDSLVIFTADHGEEFWEHEGFEHGHTMYDEVLSVPLMVKLPGDGSARGPVDVPVSNLSITPTILEVAGLAYEPDEFSAPTLVRAGPEGMQAEASERPLVSSAMLYFEDRSAVVAEGFKYVRYHISGREELYDLVSDPGEHVNLAASDAERLQRGNRLLDAHLEEAEDHRERLGIAGPESAYMDAETRRRLRSLGYVR